MKFEIGDNIVRCVTFTLIITLITILFVLFSGEPDLVDAVISRIMKK